MSCSLVRAVAVLGYVAALCAFDLSPAAARTFESAEEVAACVAANSPSADEVRAIRLTTRDRAGRERSTRLNVFARAGGDGVLMQFTDPPELIGAAFLAVREADGYGLFVHTAGADKTKRLSGREVGSTLFGTDFSAEDMARFQGFDAWKPAAREADAVVLGQPVVVLSIVPDPGTSAYVRVVGSFHADRCVPVKLEMIEADGSVRKRLLVDAVTRVGERWVPERATLRDLKEQTETELSLGTVFDEVEIPPAVFEPEKLAFQAPKLVIDAPSKAAKIEIELLEPLAPAPPALLDQ